MSFFDSIFGEFVDVIDWTDDTGDTLVWRFERHQNAIKHGAKLTVREAQSAVFVHEGRVADVFQPGMYKLHTNNLPILSTLQHWDHGFESPFKSEVYFVSRRRFTDLKWGTRNPVMLRDPEFGPIRLRAFGTYTLRVTDPGLFLREIVGTDGEFTTHEITDQLRNVIVSRFTHALATSHVPALDLAANLEDLSAFIKKRIEPDLAAYGVETPMLLIENISLPPEVEKALDRRTAMGVVGDLKKYAQFQAAEALRASADGEGGGGMALGAGMGAGMAMGHQMGGMFGPGGDAGAPASAPVAAPPPLPGGARARWHAALDGAAAGPFTDADLRGHASAGRLTVETLVWRAGLGDWTPAGELRELAGLFQSPPPLPAG
ncbi:MAG: SPFH domain-containing protein [Pseudomonadota bacterium]